MRLHTLVIAVALASATTLASPTAHAGRGCEQKPITPEAVANAADTALQVARALDERNAPVAVIARVGTDLSQQGLRYSHAGFAVRDHQNGRWTVVHLLNKCETDKSSLYAQGLVNFFADDLINQDARIVWLPQAQAQQLAQHLLNIPSQPANRMFLPNYNLIARPGSTRTQNSTAWVLETLAVTQMPAHTPLTRPNAWRTLEAHNFSPDIIRVSYGRRVLGGLFAANVDFTDHSVSTRLNGQYPVVTVRSIFRYMDESALTESPKELRNGQWQTSLGPA